jgi:hypothetical protein
MPMFSAGDVQKRPEAALLRIVKTATTQLALDLAGSDDDI